MLLENAVLMIMVEKEWRKPLFFALREMLVKSCYPMDINFDRHRRRDRIRVYVKESLFKNTRVPK